jgi:DNA invertase Pin-like site-specific DNA recombinase
MNANDIAASHRSRLAFIYVRQSSPHQVLHHRESQLRQRSFQQRAADLGWPVERISVIDEDLGVSATKRHQDRTGFQDLVAEAALGHVGIILALELSRLSRTNQDWYHLLDICAVTGTLLADEEAVYDPRAYNDRLLLGLKGTMSEAEIHIMKQRLVEAMHAKAKRGEFCFRLPAGFEWDEANRMVKTADEQVRSSIELVFARFEQWGTIHRVQSSMVEDGLQVPIMSGPRARLRWGRPDYAHLRRILTHPIYAGAYCYGRRQVEQYLDADQRPARRMKDQPQQRWHVLIRNHHEPYLSWERFERIQQQIESNRRSFPGPGAPREGRALLQGLILCGQCGRRMRVLYNSRSAHLRYCCVRPQAGLPGCQDFSGGLLERGVEELVLEALQPVGMEAMIQAAADHGRASEAERAHWQQRVERARYEVDLARRQYEAVDPGNRLVGRELERRFENALQGLEEIESKTQAQMQRMDRPLTEEEQHTLKTYAEQLPRLWHAATTPAQERKRIVRCLIEMVLVTAPKGVPHIKADIHWIGGQVTPIEVQRGRRGITGNVTDPEMVDLLCKMAAEFSDAQMARILNRKGLRTATGLVFTAHRVSNLRHSHGIEIGTLGQKGQSQDTYTAEEAARLLGVHRCTVTRWVEVGLLHGSQVTPAAPWRVRVTEQDRQRLSIAAGSADGWLPLKGAAQVLRVSQQTVLQRIKTGELQAVRVHVRSRSAWRILVTDKTQHHAPSLLFDAPNS